MLFNINSISGIHKNSIAGTHRSSIGGTHKRRSCILVLLLLMSLMHLYSQDVYFSQPNNKLLYLNPGFAGIEGDARVNISYRNQWPGSATSFETYYASYEQAVDALHGGLGLYIMDDRSGQFMNLFDLSLIYAYKLQLSSKLFLQAGFQLSANQRSIGTDGLIFPDMIDPTGIVHPTEEIFGKLSKFYMDYSAGVVAYSGEWTGGFALMHLTKPEIAMSHAGEMQLSRKYTFYLNRNILVTHRPQREDSWIISPDIQYSNQKPFSYFNYGFILSKSLLSAGMHLHNDLKFDHSFLSFSAGFRNSFMRFTYSYDVLVTNSVVYRAPGGTHELGLVFGLKTFNKSRLKHAIKLPGI